MVGLGMERWRLGLGAALAVLTVAAMAQAAPRRLALSLGEAKYQFAGKLDNAANDAHDMGAALHGLGFDVVDTADLDHVSFDKAVAAFAAKVRPGDTVVVFYAGHGVMGLAAPQSEAVDNYFVPVDAKLLNPQQVPVQSVGLTRLLQALDKAGAGARIVIVDACRDNPFADQWPKDDAAPAGGLVQPPSASLKNVYIAFATAPGSVADDNSEGKNGLFTQELLKRIDKPGQTVNGLFEEASEAVESQSNGKQIPWFAAGGGGPASLVLKPAPPGTAPAPGFDAMTLDLRLQREALACGLPLCLESAAADMRTPALKAQMTARARSLREAVRDKPADGATPAMGAPAFDAATYRPEVAVYVAANSGTLEGWNRIADRFMAGADGFPKDEAAAMRWYRAAAMDGSGAAAYAIGSAYHHGASGVPRNPSEAYRWFVRGAKIGYPQAFGMGGEYNAKGLGGRTKDEVEAVRWFTGGAQRGDGFSTRRLADMTFAGAGGLAKNPVLAQTLYLQAANYGDGEAMIRIGDFYLFANPNGSQGIKGDKTESLRWYRKAADLHLTRAYVSLSNSYEHGYGAPIDLAEAQRWLRTAADTGDDQAEWMLGMDYAKGGLGLARDCTQAALWLRRSATAGNYYARLELNAYRPLCPY